MTLSTLTISKLKPPKSGRREVYDRQVPGFGIRITDRGVKSFIFLYTSPTKHKRARITIGRVGEINLETAREQARELRRLVRAKKDPGEVRVSTHHGFPEVVEVYARRILDGQRSGADTKQIINRELMPVWGSRSIAEITRGDVLDRVEHLIDAGKPEAARRLFAIIRRLFNWVIARGVHGIDRSPCDRLRPADIIGRKPSRSRILSDDELRELWRATERIGYPFGSMLRLLLLSGLRCREISDARWTELDLGKAVFTIPKERMKGGVAHVVPLTAEMTAIINALPRIDGNECLFTSGLVGDRPISGFAEMKKRLDRLMGTAMTGPWVLHDIRRTFRTRLSRLPVPEGDLVRELMMAHAKPELHRIYDQEAYLEERRRGYELWEERLMAIVRSPAAPICPPAAPTSAPAV
jgi:integrase